MDMEIIPKTLVVVHGLNKYQPEAICHIQALLITFTPTLKATKNEVKLLFSSLTSTQISFT